MPRIFRLGPLFTFSSLLSGRGIFSFSFSSCSSFLLFTVAGDGIFFERPPRCRLPKPWQNRSAVVVLMTPNTIFLYTLQPFVRCPPLPHLRTLAYHPHSHCLCGQFPWLWISRCGQEDEVFAHPAQSILLLQAFWHRSTHRNRFCSCMYAS